MKGYRVYAKQRHCVQAAQVARNLYAISPHTEDQAVNRVKFKSPDTGDLKVHKPILNQTIGICAILHHLPDQRPHSPTQWRQRCRTRPSTPWKHNTHGLWTEIEVPPVTTQYKSEHQYLSIPGRPRRKSFSRAVV